MKKIFVPAVFFILISSFVFSSENDLLIPQSDKLYLDLSNMAKAGLIKSEKPEYFKLNAMTKMEAAVYIAEALENGTPPCGGPPAPERRA